MITICRMRRNPLPVIAAVAAGPLAGSFAGSLTAIGMNAAVANVAAPAIVSVGIAAVSGRPPDIVAVVAAPLVNAVAGPVLSSLPAANVIAPAIASSGVAVLTGASPASVVKEAAKSLVNSVVPSTTPFAAAGKAALGAVLTGERPELVAQTVMSQGMPQQQSRPTVLSQPFADALVTPAVRDWNNAIPAQQKGRIERLWAAVTATFKGVPGADPQTRVGLSKGSVKIADQATSRSFLAITENGIKVGKEDYSAGAGSSDVFEGGSQVHITKSKAQDINLNKDPLAAPSVPQVVLAGKVTELPGKAWVGDCIAVTVKPSVEFTTEAQRVDSVTSALHINSASKECQNRGKLGAAGAIAAAAIAVGAPPAAIAATAIP